MILKTRPLAIAESMSVLKTAVTDCRFRSLTSHEVGIVLGTDYPSVVDLVSCTMLFGAYVEVIVTLVDHLKMSKNGRSVTPLLECFT